MFTTPNRIDRTKTIERKCTMIFKTKLNQDTVAVVPLVTRVDAEYQNGFCAYNNAVDDSPEVEIICGGLNDKTLDGAGIWRQGNLLKFGFDLSPTEMNDTARALLVNSIVYIAKFTQDRPIVRVVTPEWRYAMPRDWLARWLKRPELILSLFEDAISPDLLAQAPGKTREDYAQWFETTRAYLHPGPDNRLIVDAEAEKLKLKFDQPDFGEKALAMLRAGGDAAEPARLLLARYLPDGPGAKANVTAWQAWVDENRPYLFFSEWGGYRWYVDPLAKARKVPTAEVRGPARADRPETAARPVGAPGASELK